MIERATVAVLCRPVRFLRKTFIAGTLLSTIVMIVTASAQSDYPNRPVQLIVPYGAGGIADVGMRILADQLTGRLKQQFVVENRPGAGGILAAKAAASAAPDGYTVLMTGNNNAISASLFKSLTPYCCIELEGDIDIAASAPKKRLDNLNEMLKSSVSGYWGNTGPAVSNSLSYRNPFSHASVAKFRGARHSAALSLNATAATCVYSAIIIRLL